MAETVSTRSSPTDRPLDEDVSAGCEVTDDRREAQSAREHDAGRRPGPATASVTASETRRRGGDATADEGGRDDRHRQQGGDHDRRSGGPALVRARLGGGRRTSGPAAGGLIEPLDDAQHRRGRPNARMRQGAIGSGMPAGRSIGRVLAQAEVSRGPRPGHPSGRPTRTASSIPVRARVDRSDEVPFPGRPRGVGRSRPRRPARRPGAPARG